MSRKAPLSHSLAALTFLAAVAALPGCKEEDTRLFDETGVWSLSHYTDDMDEFLMAPSNTHEDAFMLKFNSSKKLVAAAACSFQNGNAVPGQTSCRIGDPEDLEWECSCFKYEYSDSMMRWVQYAPADGPPSSVPSGSGDTEGDNGVTEVFLAEYPSVSNSYIFEPLPGPSTLDPDGLFASNGVDTRYVFLNKFDAIFDESGCEEVCF